MVYTVRPLAQITGNAMVAISIQPSMVFQVSALVYMVKPSAITLPKAPVGLAACTEQPATLPAATTTEYLAAWVEAKMAQAYLVHLFMKMTG